MAAWWLYQHILVTLLLYFPVSLSENTVIFGTYNSRIESVKICETPDHPYMRDPPMFITLKMHNTSRGVILEANVTFVRDTKAAKFRLKGFTWENNKWKLFYLMNDVSCRGVLLHLIIKVTGVKYDRKACMFSKGQYHSRNLDINAMHHVLLAKLPYGKLLWRSEVYHPQLGAYYCNEMHEVIEPA